MSEISSALKKILMLVLFGVIVSAFLLGLRATALKSSYDAALPYNVTDSNSVVHTLTPTATISADTIALLYTLGVALVGVIVVVGIVFIIVKEIKNQ